MLLPWSDLASLGAPARGAALLVVRARSAIGVHRRSVAEREFSAEEEERRVEIWLPSLGR